MGESTDGNYIDAGRGDPPNALQVHPAGCLDERPPGDQANRLAEVQTGVLEAAETRRAATSGVSLDEEMSDMMYVLLS